MRKHLRAAAMMVGVMSSGGAWASSEGEAEREDRSDLPAPVAERLKSEFPRATVAEAERWGDGWQATLTDGVRRQDLRLDAFGNVVERHLPVSVRELPSPLLQTLDRTHPRHTAWRATRIETAAGVFHEVLLARGERRSVVMFDPDGRVLAGLKT
jgi:hypothetical protein